MEYFELLQEDGTRSGKTKERNAVHRDGDLHGGAHLWVTRQNPNTGKREVLLQKRSDDKDSYPGCLDVSSAGHMTVGETFESTAVRECKEELNLVITENDLTFLHMKHIDCTEQFHGAVFHNNEIIKVYHLSEKVSLDTLSFQKSEISGLIWMDPMELKQDLIQSKGKYCIDPKEYDILLDFFKKEEQL